MFLKAHTAKDKMLNIKTKISLKKKAVTWVHPVLYVYRIDI